jgi:YD repeat-containing protein
MANLGTGNLLIQSNDLNVHERGIDLAFQRTWNSQSTHNAQNTDGTIAGLYGNGWTNPFDAHIRFDAAQSTITVYDIDGAAYTYKSNGDGTWAQPPGQFAILSPDTPSSSDKSLSTDCGYWWTKKTGTAYFFQIADSTKCGLKKSFNGFLGQILGRNINNNLQLSYNWGGTEGSTTTLASINVTHSDGQSLTLQFAKLNGGGHNELQSVTASPSGYQVTYGYKSNGDLASVTRPGNNASATLTEYYGYSASGNSYQVCNPRAVLSNPTNPGTPSDGDCIKFDLDATDRVVDWIDDGVANISPADSSGSGAIQQGLPSGLQIYYEEWFSYGVNIANPSGQLQCGAAGATEAKGDSATFVCDTHNHASLTVLDDTGRPVQRYGYVTASSSLTTSQTWDSQNQISSATDARGNTTNYAYDDRGNTIAVALPATQDSAAALGSARATSLYSYDAYNNVLAYCDPVETHALGKDWSGIPTGDARCPTSPPSGSKGTGASVYVYSPTGTAPEPYGRLTDTYTPLGYHEALQYAATTAGGGGNYSLPTRVQGDSFAQNDKTTRQPTQTFTYDAFGNLLSYNNGSGTWSLTYDPMNRVLTTVDPDGSLSGSSPANYTSYKCYYPDGSVKYTETGFQHATDVAAGNSATCVEGVGASTLPAATRYKYDVDGNEVSEVHHFGIIPGNAAESLPEGETTKFYDSLDRLVEVAQPRDPVHDMTSYAWLTRYFYDLGTQAGGTVQIGPKTGLEAHGGLFKTVECLPSNLVVVPLVTTSGGCSFQDVRGTTSDALDRPTAQYEAAFNNGLTPKVANTYDANGNQGLLASSQNASAQSTTYTYDEAGRSEAVTFSDTTPSRTYTYDADGRVATIQTNTSSAAWAGSPLQQSYDLDGRLISAQEPSGLPNASSTTYSYYPDGKRSTLSTSLLLGAKTVNLPNALEYSYRADGALQEQDVNAGRTGQFTWAYTPAGREITQKDPSLGLTFNAVIATGVNGSTQYPVTYVARRTTYDAYGRQSTVQLPVGYNESLPTYDLEGDRISYQITSPTLLPKSISMGDAYTIRGELANEWTPQANSLRASPFSLSPPVPCETGASGCAPAGDGNLAPNQAGQQAVFLGYTPPSAAAGQPVSSFDARTDQVSGQSEGPGSVTVQPNGANIGVAYDATGRQWTKTSSCQVYQPPQYLTGPSYPGGSVQTRTYDAENHNISESYAFPTNSVRVCAGDSTTQYNLAWGLSGHPWVVNDLSFPGTTATSTLHWDGDTLLYEVDPNNQLTIFVGKVGWITNPQTATSPIATADRDWTGTQSQWHQYDYFSTYSPPGAHISMNLGGTAKIPAKFTVTWWGDSVGNFLPGAAARRSTSSAISVNASSPGAVIVSPASLSFDGVGSTYAKSVTATQSKYSGTFTHAGDCGPVATIADLSNANGSASYIVTPVAAGSCSATFKGGNGLSATLSISVAPKPVIVSPTSLGFDALGSADVQQVAVSQAKYSGTFAHGGNCGPVATLAEISNAGGNASYSVTAVAAGSCSVTFTGGSGQTAALSISVVPDGQVLLTPEKLHFDAIGAASAKPVSVSQANFTGTFSHDGNCGGIAQFSANSNSGGNANYTVTPVGAGSCSSTFSGGAGQSAALSIVVNPLGPVVLSPTTLAFTSDGSPGLAQPFTASQTNFNGAFTLTSDCTSTGVASITTTSNAGGNASYSVEPLTVGTCTVQIIGGGSIQASLPISVTGGGPVFPADAAAPGVSMLREDGYQIEDLTIQGVRAYDPTTAEWTAPDAYSGDVHDPMSQKPFMWNENNPVSYSDPSGYCSITMPISCIGDAANAIRQLATSGAATATSATVARGGAVAAAGAAGGVAVTIGALVLATTGETGDNHEESPVEGATLEGVTGNGIPRYFKPGDEETANEDFDNLPLTGVTTKPNGTRVGTMPNGDVVDVRGTSTDGGRPTLEVMRNSKPIVKVRYGAPTVRVKN